MEFPVNPSQLIDILRTWFFAKDRSIVLADNTFIEGEDISTPGTPIVNRGRLYWKDKCWTQLDEDGVESTLCNGIWQDWTPTVDQGGAVSVNVGFARYLTLGNLVILTTKLTITGSGSAGNAIIVSGIPTAIQPSQVDGNACIGSFNILDSGVAHYAGSVSPVGADDIRFRGHNEGNYIGIDPSFALSSPNDVIAFTAFYERA